MIPTIVLTAGEPAGIGPDIVLAAALNDHPYNLVAVGSETVFRDRARALGLDVRLTRHTCLPQRAAHEPGELSVIDIPLSAPCIAGTLCATNASHVLAQLDLASELCRSGGADAMVTAPVNKAIINQSGVAFSGHTEFFAKTFSANSVVMMLVAGDLRVALCTTHLPLREVPAAINKTLLVAQLRTIGAALRQQFAIAKPRITVLGLNPHAGESGYLGREEINVIAPAISQIREEGLDVRGPASADTAFTGKIRAQTDAYLAMYHDQGLPVLKSAGFGESVNVSLGLPIIRTSVDHGTALDLAGTGDADSSSLDAAIRLAGQLSLSHLGTK